MIGTRPSIPSIGSPAKNTPARYGSPIPNKFGQSVRGTQDSRDPSKKPGFTPKNGAKSSIPPRSASALGNTPLNYSDEEETTPTGVPRTTNNVSFGSVSSFNAKMRPASRANDRANDEELERLRGQIEDRDRQLKDQASSLAEMESSLNEVQTLMGGSDGGSRRDRSSIEEKDTSQLRAMLREKNEKIAMLTAEFDAHRADFRSTIDTLELASTETERVYEKRVEDLIQEVRELSDRNEDVDSVARQLKQLEELVQELEEGLEDARRGEAEARGEVEFLRGEVERTRSELRREREKAAASVGVGQLDGASSKEVEQRDDEIRGLKAIIHSLSRDAIPNSASPGLDPSAQKEEREKFEKEIKDLQDALQAKSNKEEELEREVERLRRGSVVNPPSHRASAITVNSSGTATQDQPQPSARDSKGSVVSWCNAPSPENHRQVPSKTLETMPETDNYSSASAAESFCELCETSGHDILSCTNMFTPNGAAPPVPKKDDVLHENKELEPAPLATSPLKSPGIQIMPNPMESGPVAGKESGVVNMEKWCGVCEREGHDSIDCPFEDAF